MRNAIVKHGREKKDADSERTPRGAMSEDLDAAPFQESATLSERSVAYSVGASNPTSPKVDVLVHIRRAEPRDMRAVFELSNDPVVRANSIHSEPIEWTTHEKWFANALANPMLKFYIAESTDKALIGQVRFEERKDGCLVSISLAAAFRGKGLAQAVLLKAMEVSGLPRFMAEICADNLLSLSLFKRCGFELQTDGSFMMEGRKFERLRKVCR